MQDQDNFYMKNGNQILLIRGLDKYYPYFDRLKILLHLENLSLSIHDIHWRHCHFCQ